MNSLNAWRKSCRQSGGQIILAILSVMLLSLLGVGTRDAQALSGGPDAYGYRFIDSNEPGGPQYNFEDISGTGTRVILSDDSRSGLINIGFSFEFYGVEYTQLYIYSDCLLIFPGGSTQSSACCSGYRLPTADSWNNLIAGWWEDINPAAGGTVHYQTLGAEPNRRFIVQFTATRLFGQTDTITMQFKLFENDDSAEVHYQQTVTDSTRYSAGIENLDGTTGLQYFYGGGSLATPIAVAYFDKPKVTSILPADNNPTSATLVNYSLNFSEPVTGVDLSDLQLSGSLAGGASLISITTNTLTNYTVTVNTGPGEGDLRLDLIDDDSILGVEESEQLGGLGLLNGDFTAGTAYTIDRTGPQINSITRVGPSPATSLPVDFLVKFDEPVDGVDTEDFEVVTTGPLSNIVLIPGSRAFEQALDLTNNPENNGRHVSVPDAASLQLTNLTLEAWVKYQNDGPEVIIGKGNDYQLTINYNRTSKLELLLGGSVRNTSSATIPVNTWTHVAATYDGSQINLYINGALDHTVVYSTPMTQSTTGLAIGCTSVETQTNHFDGWIDEARVWNFARTQTEIQETMNTTLAGAQEGLMAYWRFDELTGLGAGGDSETDDFEDFSGYANHGDSVNGPIELTTSNFYGLAQYYRVRVSGDGGEGEIAVNMLDNNTIKDAARNPYGGAGAQDFTTGEVFALDTVPPSVDHVQVIDDTTIDITFNETFGMNAQAEVAANYTLSGPGMGTLAATPDTVTKRADNIFRLGWSSGALAVTGDVTITAANMKDNTGFDLVEPFSATDQRSNPYLIGITPETNGPTNLDDIIFRVEFDENVTGLDSAADILIDHNGTTHTALSFRPTYLPRIVEVTVSGIAGDGWLTMSVPDNAAEDVNGNLATGGGPSTRVYIDNTPPTVTLDTVVTTLTTPALSGLVNETTATMSITIDGQTVTGVDNNDGTWSLGAGVLSPVNDGVWDVVVAATDVAGNTGYDLTTNEVTIDAHGPAITVTPYAGTDTTPLIGGTVTDAVTGVQSMSVTVDSVQYSPTFGSGTWSLQLPSLDDGIYEVLAQAADNIGNTSADATSNELTVDTHGPQVYFAGLQSNQALPLISGTVDELIGVASLQVLIGAQSLSATVAGSSWSVTPSAPLPQGVYPVTFLGVDTLGNQATTITLTGLTIDMAVPVVTVDSVLSKQSTPLLTGTVSDTFGTIAQVQVTVNGTPYTAQVSGSQWSVQTTVALSEGTYNVAATATDLVGNTGNDATSNELLIDTTSPSVIITHRTTDDTTPVIAGTVSDTGSGVAGVEVTVGAVTQSATLDSGNWSVQWPQTLADGTYNVSATATDAAGNTGSDSSANELIVDANGPAVHYTPVVTSNTNVVLSGTIKDTVSEPTTLTLQVDGRDFVGYLSTLAPPDFPIDGFLPPATNKNWFAVLDNIDQGTYDVNFTAIDKLGNIATTTTLAGLTVDQTWPTVTVHTLSTNQILPVITGSAYDTFGTLDGRVVVAVNGTTYTTQMSEGMWSVQTTAILDQGVYDVVAITSDTAGHVSYDTSSDELTVDQSTPSVSVNALTTSDTTPLLTGSVSDAFGAIYSVQVTVNSQTYTASRDGETWSLQVPLALSNGVYEVAARAVDLANNSGYDSTSNELTIDTIVPQVVINSQLTRSAAPVVYGTVYDAYGTLASVMVTINGTTYTAQVTGSVWAVTVGEALADGTYAVSSVATDTAGNKGTATDESGLQIDRTAPIVTIQSIATSDQTPQINIDTDDAHAVIQVRAQVDGQWYEAANRGSYWSIDVATTMTQGYHDVQALATDQVGNLGQDTTTNEVLIDLTIPQITVDTLFTSQTTPTLTGQVIDLYQTVTQAQIVVDGTTYTTPVEDGGWSVELTQPLAQGVYDVHASATNGAGKTGTDLTRDELTVDVTPPMIMVANLITSDTTPLLSGWLLDDITSVTQVIVTIGQTTASAQITTSTWTVDWPTALAEGVYDVTATATDFVGLTGSDFSYGELTIDVTRPLTSITGPGVALTRQGPLTYHVTYSEQLGSTPTLTAQDITLARMGTADANVEVTHMTDLGATVTLTSITGDGTLAIAVAAGTARDLAGNPAQASPTSLACTVDNTAPTVTFSTDAPSSSTADSVTFTLTFSEPVSGTLSLEDLSSTGDLPCTVTLALVSQNDPVYVVRATPLDPLANGLLGIEVIGAVNDAAGNMVAVPAASEQILLVHTGTVNITPVPDRAMWTMVDSLGNQTQGSGKTRLTGVPSGTVQVIWEAVAGYNPPTPSIASKTLSVGGQVDFLGIFQPLGSDAVQATAGILQYLLGLTSDPTGLDVNQDGQVDIADYLWQQEDAMAAVPANPSPADHAWGVDTTTTFDWDDSLNADHYDVYLWEMNTERPATPAASDLTQSQVSLALDANTAYAWQVVAHNVLGSTPGPVWIVTPQPAMLITSQTNDEQYHAGDTIQVSWLNHIEVAGWSVLVELWKDDAKVADLGGSFKSDYDPQQDYDGTTQEFTLPADLPVGTGYRVRTVSPWLRDLGAPQPWTQSTGQIEIIE